MRYSIYSQRFHRSQTDLLILCISFVLMMSFSTFARQDVKEAIVKIFTIRHAADYYTPWSMRGPYSGTGSGCIIKGKKILTNAHVVSDQTFVQVRRYGESKRYQARVLSVSHTADLALLTVDDPTFFDGVEPLEFGNLPLAQQEILVYGFPMGGDSLSITKGVVSRIEHTRYAHSSATLLAVQLDAAINPGNSGGPALIDDKIIGVSMQVINNADNIGYVIPVPVIQHFMSDIEDGSMEGFPSMGIAMQGMESPAMKAKYGMDEEQTGMLITKVLPGSSADGYLQDGDVLLKVEGYELADDGSIEFRPKERTSVSYLVQKHQIGDMIQADILRKKEPMSVDFELTRKLEDDWLIPLDQYDIVPTYYIYGGIVFCPVTVDLLKAWGSNWYDKAPKDLMAKLHSNIPDKENEQIVIVLKVLADEVNKGYHGFSNWTIDKVNGKKILNIEELINIVEQEDEDPFVVFEDTSGNQIVLNRDEIKQNNERILEVYRVPKDRSPDLE